MTIGGTNERALRAASAVRLVVGVLALYALVLGTLLGTIAGAGATAPDGILCQQQPGDAADDPQHGADHDHGCCIAACVSPALAARLASEPSLAWPARPAIRLAWRICTVPPARAPPRTLASPRGPPAA